MQPVLSKLSRVQDETKASIALSTRLIRGHLDFCCNMQSTLQHGANAGGSDCRLSHDSAVVSAGAVVSERFAALGEHIATLQGMILDVAQELRGIGERRFTAGEVRPAAFGERHYKPWRISGKIVLNDWYNVSVADCSLVLDLSFKSRGQICAC